MIAIQLLTLVVLMAMTIVGPGLLVVRRLRWSPGEKFCAAIAVSLVLIYLASLAIFTLEAPIAWHWTVTAIALAATWWVRKDILAILRNDVVRRMLAGFLVLLIWCVGWLLVIRHFAGGSWGGDWWWHAHKEQVFLSSRLPDFQVARDFVIERPGLMNLVAAHFLASLDGRFEWVEVVFTFLNLLVFLPCVLILRALARQRPGRGAAASVLTLLMMSNPMLVENATYTWTKLLAAFYIILAVWFYLAAIRKHDGIRLIAAFAALGGGGLTHYLTVPYAIVIAGHLAMVQLLAWRRNAWGRRQRQRQRRFRWRDVLGAVSIAAGMGATWLGWVLWQYGLGEAMQSNRTIEYYRRFSARQNVLRVLRNIRDTILPHPLHVGLAEFRQADWRGFLRDYMFLMYQTNLWLAMGLIGGLVIGWRVYRALGPRRTPKGAAAAGVRAVMAGAAAAFVGLSFVGQFRDVVFDLFPNYLLYGIFAACVAVFAGDAYRMIRNGAAAAGAEAGFWRWFVLMVPLVAIVGHDAATDFGLAHIFLHPIAFVGLAYLAAEFGALAGWLRLLVLAGAVADFFLGVLVQMHLQSWRFGYVRGPGGAMVLDTRGLRPQAAVNWSEKVAKGYTFLADHVTKGTSDAIEIALTVAFLTAVVAIVRQYRLLDSKTEEPKMAAISE